ncbi:MAG: chloramphenicol phosphotransferase [Pseudomonadota bacterium]|nr:chloramphenicol phosphotransferase [Pseudomonadota bacterium]
MNYMESVSSNLAQIVVLNGVSSAGKSSLARAVQAITWPPFLHAQLDVFTQMLPLLFKKRHVTEQTPESGCLTPAGEANIDEIVSQTRRGMRYAIAAMAAQGLRLIIDDVLDDAAAEEYVRLLAPYRTHFVGVLASLEVLECREQKRGDRVIGLARSQLAFAHRNIRYDMTIDTSSMTPTEGALQIKNQLGL